VYPIGSSQGQVSIGGRTWELWYGLNNAMKVYSFIALSPVTSFSGDLKEFFKYLANNKGFPVATQNLISKPFSAPCCFLRKSVPV
jgi:xyloglucan-specific endo-beta-1,4-glucanase